MSATKHRRKWAKTASAVELQNVAIELERDANGTANLMIRSSLREQARICRAELQARGAMDDDGWTEADQLDLEAQNAE